MASTFMCSVGYVYNQNYDFTDKKTNERKTGFTTHCVLHSLDNDGNIAKTFDYKVAPQFSEQCAALVGQYTGAPMFDGFQRLAGFFS